MSMHSYQCSKCMFSFKCDDKYEEKTNNDPKLRNCPKCRKARGGIYYYGTCAFVAPPISDKLWDMKSHADGKTYDSKSAYYRSLKDNGSHIIEPGEQVYDKQREMTGDFNCRKELKQALEKHLH